MPRYSAKFREHASEPLHMGRMANADAIGEAYYGSSQQFVRLYLRIAADTIEHATFECHACGAAMACGSALTELIIGKTVRECGVVTSEHLIQALDGIPPDRQVAVSLVISALQNAVSAMIKP